LLQILYVHLENIFRFATDVFTSATAEVTEAQKERIVKWKLIFCLVVHTIKNDKSSSLLRTQLTKKPMLESIASSLLTKYLGDYVEGT
jgi:hypothetical protein